MMASCGLAIPSSFTDVHPMTTTNVASTPPASASLPTIDAELRLHLLPMADNPLPSGGTLTLIASGVPQPQRALAQGSLAHDTGPIALGPSPTLTLVLESSGLHLLRLELEVLPVTDELQDRVEVTVRSQGIATNDSIALAISAKAYTWRLSGQAAISTYEGSQGLLFDLVQELEPTAPFDPLASARLPFGEIIDDDHQARIKVKRSGMGSVASP